MATLAASVMTLSDLARLEINGQIAPIIDVMSEKNEVLDDMLWIEGNESTGHKSVIQSGYPSATWRLLNYGVAQSKGREVQVTDTCGMLESVSSVDAKLAEKASSLANFRFAKGKPHMKALAKELASTIFYGNTGSDPEKFMGLSPRFSSTSAESGSNIIKSDGTGSDNTSLWLIVWGEDQVMGIYPKGSKAGLQFEDEGRVSLYDSLGNSYMGYRSRYSWDCGLSVCDWRYCVRICNIDISNLTKDASSGSDLVDLMTQALELAEDLNGKAAFYCNRTVRSVLRRQIKNSKNVLLSMDQVAGKHVMSFDGIPVRRCDALLNTESLVA